MIVALVAVAALVGGMILGVVGLVSTLLAGLFIGIGAVIIAFFQYL